MAERTTTFEAAAFTQQGTKRDKVELPQPLFDGTVNTDVMHQAVKAYLANQRQGNASTKTRGLVVGGNQKPWKQKGTGRARQGSIRAPHWRGGGVTHAPKPRSYKQRTPKKMIRLALASALSDRRADDKVIVLDSWGIDTPSTKAAVEVLGKLGVEGRVLVVLGREEADVAVWKSLRNLQNIHVLTAGELNAYDVLVSDWVVFTKASLPATRVAADAATDSEGSETK
jgi:large subunit ribosomal protein L4